MDSEILELIGAAAGGAAVGAGLTYLATTMTAPTAPIPASVLELLDTVTVRDVGTGRWLTNRVVWSYYTEGDWEIWIIGLGEVGVPPNDIVIDLGHNKVTGQVNATIAKLGYNEMEVYQSGVLKVDIPYFTVTGAILQAAIILPLGTV
jgi:hypothetical protein